MVEPIEKLLMVAHQNTEYCRNAANEGPKLAPAAILRVDDATDLNLEHGVQLDAERTNNLNDAPTLAYNKLLGQTFFRNKMEGIWFKSVSQG